MSAAKLNQIVAIEKGIKSRVHQAVSENYKIVQKAELFNGFDKKYQPKAEDGEHLAPETKHVQHQVANVLEAVKKLTSELFEVTARKDWTNTTARASVSIDGQTILADVPVTYLLFLEKNLTDLRTFVSALPILDPAEEWNLDANSGLYKTKEVQTHRTKKEQKALVMYPATEKHPAQTQLVTEDVISGFWKTVKLSGAVPRPSTVSTLEKIETLLKAVKEAREEANMTSEVESPNVGTAIFGYIFG